jgi:hypothetical protein
MEDVSVPKKSVKASKESKKIEEEKKTEQLSDLPQVSKMEVDNESAIRLKDNDTDNAESEFSKARLCKRPAEAKETKVPESKRKKTDKGEKNVGADKRKIRHIEWQYGRH